MMTVGTWLTGLVCLTLLYGAVTPLRALWDPRVPAVVNWGLDYSQRAGIANGGKSSTWWSPDVRHSMG